MAIPFALLEKWGIPSQKLFFRLDEKGIPWEKYLSLKSKAIHFAFFDKKGIPLGKSIVLKKTRLYHLLLFGRRGDSLRKTIFRQKVRL